MVNENRFTVIDNEKKQVYSLSVAADIREFISELYQEIESTNTLDLVLSIFEVKKEHSDKLELKKHKLLLEQLEFHRNEIFEVTDKDIVYTSDGSREKYRHSISRLEKDLKELSEFIFSYEDCVDKFGYFISKKFEMEENRLFNNQIKLKNLLRIKDGFEEGVLHFFIEVNVNSEVLSKLKEKFDLLSKYQISYDKSEKIKSIRNNRKSDLKKKFEQLSLEQMEKLIGDEYSI